MDIASIQAHAAYSATKSSILSGDTSETALDYVTSFAETLAQNETVAVQSMTGQGDAHALVQALTQTELAVDTAVTIRNKVVEAYQEILRMPV